jgi:hypothetical protein
MKHNINQIPYAKNQHRSMIINNTMIPFHFHFYITLKLI